MTQGSNVRPDLTLSPHDRRRIAVAATCDPECVVKYLAGSTSLRSTTVDRIERALRNHNFESVIEARAASLASR